MSTSANTSRLKKLTLCLLIFVILAPILLIAASYYIIEPYKKYIVSPDSVTQTEIGLVLGAGINQETGQPYDELKARLDSAALALNSGTVNKLILSGDNRFVNYNEPQAMQQYLINKGVPSEKLIADYAGRSTYESCERAAKIFGLKQTIIFSAQSHLPRAIYLCRHFGIETYGISSSVEANNSMLRELLARVKAIYNANIKGEQTVLGEPIPVN